jgi:hypothetical protein
MSHSDYAQRIQETIQQTPMTDRATLEYLSKMLSAVLLGDVTEAEQYFNVPKEPPPHMRLNRREIQIEHFECGLSEAFLNKENLTGNKAAMANSFRDTHVTPVQFITHVLDGKAWTPGIFRDNHRVKTKHISAQLIALDCDDHVTVDDAIMEFLICEYALLIHASPSSTPEHPKTRVIFLLSEPITEGTRYEAIVRGMHTHFAAIRPDRACKDSARFFYGSNVGEYDAFPNAVLPIAIAATLTTDEAYEEYYRHEQKRHEQPRVFNTDQMHKYVQTAYESELMLVQTAPQGQRHKQLYKSACAIFGMVKGGWSGITAGQAERDLEHASKASESEIAEVRRVINDAARVATARELRVG